MTTKTYIVSNSASGLDLGSYQGSDADEAIAAMLADAGCDDAPSESLVATEAPKYRIDDQGPDGFAVVLDSVTAGRAPTVGHAREIVAALSSTGGDVEAARDSLRGRADLGESPEDMIA